MGYVHRRYRTVCNDKICTPDAVSKLVRAIEQGGADCIGAHADYEFMVRFLKDEKNRLVYVLKVLIAMFYGGRSNAGLRNYWVSFKEGYRALRKNDVPHPLLITVKRSIRVLRQF